MAELLSVKKTNSTTEDITIQEITNSAEFFHLLPDSWIDSLLPYWTDYEKETRIYGIFQGDELLGGGIIFSSPAPDSEDFLNQALSLFKSGYLYIGYLWVCPEHRGKGLGKNWMDGVREIYPDNLFWLSIEELSLRSYYLRHNFSEFLKVDHEDGYTEWVFVENPR